MATEHTLRLKTQLDTSDTERQLNRLDAAGKGSGGSGQSLNQVLRTAGFFAAAQQFERAAERINRAAGEMRSAISEAMSRVGTMGLQGFAAGGAKGGAVGLAAGGALAAIDYFIQVITDKARELDRSLQAQNQASANANRFIKMADAAQEAENLATTLKTGSIPALQELKAKYDKNIEAVQAQVDEALKRAKTTNQLGDNEVELLDKLQTLKAASDACAEAIDKLKKAEQQRLQNFTDAQQQIEQNRRDQRTLASGDIFVLQDALKEWQEKVAEATSSQDAQGLSQAASMVDRYNAAIQTYWDELEQKTRGVIDKEKNRVEKLSEARSGWLERTENAEILRSGDPQAIKAQIEKYRKAMLTATTGEEFLAAAGWVDRFTAQLQQLQNLPQFDVTELNRQLGSLHGQGAYMGENAVGIQTEDFTRKTSETVSIISTTLKDIQSLVESIKRKDSEATLG